MRQASESRAEAAEVIMLNQSRGGLRAYDTQVKPENISNEHSRPCTVVSKLVQ
jgi:hypothetical protein